MVVIKTRREKDAIIIGKPRKGIAFIISVNMETII